MLAIAPAPMGRPELLLLDEPSTGLAALIVREIFSVIKQLNQYRKLTPIKKATSTVNMPSIFNNQ